MHEGLFSLKIHHILPASNEVLIKGIIMLKKSVLIGATLALFSLPLIAQADLFTTNNTDQWSSVIVTTNKNTCSGTAAHGVTNPHSTTQTTSGEVRALCGTTPCHADIIMETSLDAAKKCTGIKIGTAVLNDLNTDVILQKDINITDANYSVISNESTQHSTITISKK
jgi:hypothetical protein